jgi:hypothetical protein
LQVHRFSLEKLPRLNRASLWCDVALEVLTDVVLAHFFCKSAPEGARGMEAAVSASMATVESEKNILMLR